MVKVQVQQTVGGEVEFRGHCRELVLTGAEGKCQRYCKIFDDLELVTPLFEEEREPGSSHDVRGGGTVRGRIARWEVSEGGLDGRRESGESS